MTNTLAELKRKGTMENFVKCFWSSTFKREHGGQQQRKINVVHLPVSAV